MNVRGRLLILLDNAEAEHRADCIQRLQAGRDVAARESRALVALAAGIAKSLAEWREHTGRLNLAASFDARRAGTLVLESVFDEILSGPQWRILAAAFDLTDSAQ